MWRLPHGRPLRRVAAASTSQDGRREAFEHSLYFVNNVIQSVLVTTGANWPSGSVAET
jgi:hypothetical protein